MFEHVLLHVLIHYAKQQSGSSGPAGPSTLESRAIPNLVCCENCRFEFVYFMFVTVRSFGYPRPAENAQTALYPRTVARDWVPCPNCGWVQLEMYRTYRANWAYLFLALGVLASILLLVALFGEHLRPRVAWLSVKAASLVVTLPALVGACLASFWRGLYNPNSSTRKLMQNAEKGKRRAVPRAQYEAQRIDVIRAERELFEARAAAALTVAAFAPVAESPPASVAGTFPPAPPQPPEMTPPAPQLPLTEEAKRRAAIMERRRREEEESRQRREATRALRNAVMNKRIERGPPDAQALPRQTRKRS
ncbi:hypothetical protein PLCT2_02034 [Planctomycetaceae bacterium]|nr:hypothetical protein PLCT2_02034 [Planctomycetaceae bacterium]